jgi:ferredoxin
MTTLLIRRVWIERGECTSHTLCITETSGLIELDPDGDSAVVKEAALQRTQQELQELLEASFVCPMAAFHIETADGSTFCLGNELLQRAIRQGGYRWA